MPAFDATRRLPHTSKSNMVDRHAKYIQSAPIFAYVGCYSTARRNSHGDGIHAYRLDYRSGTWSHFQHVPDLVNPSWLSVNSSQSALYSAHADEDYVTSFAIERDTGQLTLLNSAKAGGVNGVRTIIDPSERFLIIANYQSGNLSVLPINADRSLRDCTQIVALPGSPRHLHRSHNQESSRPHDCIFDPSGRFLICPDKGLDRVFIFSFDPSTGRLTPCDIPFAQTRNAAGPRHILFHPEGSVAWVVNELDSTLATYEWDATKPVLRQRDVAFTLPGDFTEDSWTSEIAFDPSTHALYISNRGHDSITLFKVDRRTETPRLMEWIKTGGKQPRFFAIGPTGRFLYVANQKSDNIVVFRIGLDGGRLTSTGEIIASASPTAIVFVAGNG